MTKHTLSAHPALTAIAVSLAFVSTSASAQDAQQAATAPAPEIVVPSAQPAPAPAVPTPSVTLPPLTVQAPPPAPAIAAAPPLPQVEPQQRIARAEAAPGAERAAPVERRTATPAERPAQIARPAPVIAAPAAPAEDMIDAAASPTDLRTGTTAQNAAETTASSDAATTAAPAPATATNGDNNAAWVLGAGGAALLVGVGALVFLRRRDRREDAIEEGYATTATAAPAAAREPIAAEPVLPVRQPEPVSAAAIHAVAATPTAEPETGREPAREMAYMPAGPGAWAPASPATAQPALASGSARERFAEIDAMAAAAPSADNPFRSRRNRLRRAEFIRAHGHAPQGPAMISETPERIEPAKQPASQQVYSFGATPSRPRGWKPITT